MTKNEQQREINKIIIHCSDSDWGDAVAIDGWHKARGWSRIGYHFVVNNPYRYASSIKQHVPDFSRDGLVEIGRPLSVKGAHCLGENDDSVGIVLIGKNVFTSQQIISTKHIIQQYGLEGLPVYGHSEFNTNKTCPNINCDILGSLFS